MTYAPLRFRRSTLSFAEARVMAVVNVTPDSFSDGGLRLDAAAAIAAGLAAAEAGADIIDIGGESTRPGATPVSAATEQARVLPVIAALAARVAVPISVDTCKAETARLALDAGAEIVNDVSGGRADPAIVAVAAAAGAAFVLCHVRGTGAAAAHLAEASPPSFDEVADDLAVALAGLPPALAARTLVDPGLGFGKAGAAANLPLLVRGGELAARLGRPVLVGPSRKRFVGEILAAAGSPLLPAERDDGTVGACLAAVLGGASVLRVHDVRRTRDALLVFAAARAAAGPR